MKHGPLGGPGSELWRCPGGGQRWACCARLAHGHDVLHRGVEVGREHEGDARLLDTPLDAGGGQRKVDAERLEYIGGAAPAEVQRCRVQRCRMSGGCGWWAEGAEVAEGAEGAESI